MCAVKANGLTVDDAELLGQLSEICSKELFTTSDKAARRFVMCCRCIKREQRSGRSSELVPTWKALFADWSCPARSLIWRASCSMARRARLEFLPWQSRARRFLGDRLRRVHRGIAESRSGIFGMYRDKGFEIVGVNMNRDAEEVKRLVIRGRHHLAYVVRNTFRRRALGPSGRGQASDRRGCRNWSSWTRTARRAHDRPRAEAGRGVAQAAG